MQTVWCFMNEDNADFDEALKSAIERRNFLLNRLFKKKPLLDEYEEEKEEEEEVKQKEELWMKKDVLLFEEMVELVTFISGLIKKKLKFESDEVTFII